MCKSTISMEQVLPALGIPLPSKDESAMTCPFCGKKKKMYVRMSKNVFNCFACGEAGSAIDLYGMVSHNYTKEQLRTDKPLFAKLCSELDNGTPTNYTPRVYSKEDDTPVAPIENRDAAYRAFLSGLSLKQEHFDNLLARGLSANDIAQHGYKSVPTEGCLDLMKDLKNQGIDLNGVPGFYVDEYGKRRPVKLDSGFFIPVVDLQGRIQGLQIRFDNPGNGPRYKWFSSSGRDSGTGAKTFTHFVGYPEDIVLLTEGPLKANIINRFLDRPVLAVPGVNATKFLIPMVQELKAMKIKKIATCFDMDFLTNDNVKRAYSNLLRMLRQQHITVVPKTWNQDYKGFDDYLLARSKGEIS